MIEELINKAVSDPAHWALVVSLWGWYGERKRVEILAQRMSTALEKLTDALLAIKSSGH